MEHGKLQPLRPPFDSSCFSSNSPSEGVAKAEEPLALWLGLSTLENPSNARVSGLTARCCCDDIPDKGNSREKVFLWGHSSRGQSVVFGGSSSRSLKKLLTQEQGQAESTGRLCSVHFSPFFFFFVF